MKVGEPASAGTRRRICQPLCRPGQSHGAEESDEPPDAYMHQAATRLDHNPRQVAHAPRGLPRIGRQFLAGKNYALHTIAD